MDHGAGDRAAFHPNVVMDVNALAQIRKPDRAGFPTFATKALKDKWVAFTLGN